MRAAEIKVGSVIAGAADVHLSAEVDDTGRVRVHLFVAPFECRGVLLSMSVESLDALAEKIAEARAAAVNLATLAR